jgi:hypothetical protein
MWKTCMSCGSETGRLRVCTKEPLCAFCRRLPEYRLMKASQVRKATGMPEKTFLHLRAGRTVNPVHPSYQRIGMYFWKDVALFCANHGLELPE